MHKLNPRTAALLSAFGWAVGYLLAGKVLAVLLLGIFYPTNGAGYTAVTVPDVEDTRQAAHTFVVELPRTYTRFCPHWCQSSCSARYFS